MSCLECKFHGPPVSDYVGPKPCAECIQYAGFPKQEPIGKEVAEIRIEDRQATDL
jgi:hypothetical protein